MEIFACIYRLAMLYCQHIKIADSVFQNLSICPPDTLKYPDLFFHGISAGKYKFDELADHTDGMYTYANASFAVTP